MKSLDSYVDTGISGVRKFETYMPEAEQVVLK